MSNKVFILGVAQSDFVGNWTRESLTNSDLEQISAG